MSTKAYAVLFADCYWLVYAEDADKAKGAILERETVESYRSQWLHTLRCRRWPECDEISYPRVMKWGVPGQRDWETGVIIEIPTPFAS